MKPIPPKVMLFVDEYMKNNFNATQAAITVGYSSKWADRYACSLVEKYRDLIEARKAEVMATSKMTLEKWVKTVTALALYDPRKMFDKFGNPLEIPELGRVSGLALAGFEIEELYDGKGENRQKIGYARKVKLLDRTPYLLMLGKYLNAFPVKVPPLPDPQANRLNWQELSLEERLLLQAELTALIQRMRQRKLPVVISGEGHGGNGTGNGHAA